MRQRDGTPHPLAGRPHPKAGQPLEDWRGRPILDRDGSVPCGVVFFNYEDAIWEGVRSSGDGILIFNRPTPEQSQQMQAYVAGRGGLAALCSVEHVRQLLQHAQHIGLDDRYNSTRAYAARSLTVVADAATGIPAYGLHLRTNEMVPAVFVPGPARVGDLGLGPEGGVFLLIARDTETGRRDVRSVSPAAFADTYTADDGSSITVADLPHERPWQHRHDCPDGAGAIGGQ
jgi:hypothetical protein